MLSKAYELINVIVKGQLRRYYMALLFPPISNINRICPS